MNRLDTIARLHSERVRDSLHDVMAPPLTLVPTRPRASWVRLGHPLSTAMVAAVAALLLLGVPFLIWTFQPTELAVGPRNGLIIIRQAEGSLAAVNLDGTLSEELRLDATGVVGIASWSADGRRIAYTNHLGVWVLDTASGKKYRVHGCTDVRWCGVAWSPDSSQLAVLDAGVLEVVDAGDGTMIRVVNTPPMDSAPLNVIWSSDGEWLVLSYRTVEQPNTGRLVGVHPDGAGMVTFYEGSFPVSYAWSRQTQSIVVLTGTQVETDSTAPFAPISLTVLLARSDGSSPEHLADVGRCACLGMTPGLTMSPDGTLIAMNVPGIATDVSQDWGLYLMGVDGSDMHRVHVAGVGNPIWQPNP